jgi:hypothetical protein
VERAGAVALACALLAACANGASAAAGHASSNRHANTAARQASKSPSASPSPTAPTAPPSPSALPVDPGAGTLRQTTARPRITDPRFQAMTSDLWLAVQTGNPAYALPAFFPVDAYKQVKAIWNPQYDWKYRLWLDFSLDVKAAHQLLGPSATSARLLRVVVPVGEEVWVGPGACYNNVGYWHVAGPRVVYQQDGQVRSFGIASLISWRGVWYVIHFGGINRGAIGMVDAPTSGPGYAGPPGGC